MEHDDKCAEQDAIIKELKARTHAINNELQIGQGAFTRVQNDLAAVIESTSAHVDSLHEHDVVLARIETELKALIVRIPLTLGSDLTTLSLTLKSAMTEIESLKVLVRADFVSQKEFDPIKKVVYGLVSLILTGVFVALIALVVRK